MKSKKAKLYHIHSTLYAIWAGCLLISAAGCGDDARSNLQNKIHTLEKDKTQLMRQIEQSEAENEQFKKQILVLSGLEPELSFVNLYHLRSIRISKYTNLYDKDKDGRYETLIVYIQPIDEEGDMIKAAGAADVQLWDLNSPQANQALLGQWHKTPSELKKLWYASLLTANYRLTFDVGDKIASFEEPLTVKVTFTDYLTGKVFKEQKVIKPR